MLIIAASLYLPEHIYFVATRAWFYWAGEEEGQTPVAVVAAAAVAAAGASGSGKKGAGVLGEGWAGGL
ncbi:hypothetical protein MMC14_005481 [Varicellaria rhodocarpa]|nr:hypothetical protein [Varicellaria rhodocarpa]